MTKSYDEVLADIQANPELHRHVDMASLHGCCTIDASEPGKPHVAIDPRLLDAHLEYAPIAYNGGRACDVFDGPCACGAWHHLTVEGRT